MLVLLLLAAISGPGPAARTLTLRTDWPGIDTLIEWRGMVPPGTSLISQERTRVSGSLSLAVPPHGRVLRLLPSGWAPLSLFIPEGTASLDVTLPRPVPGGEIFGVLPAHAHTPVALELRGKGGLAAALRPDAWRVFQASGIAPGAYTLTPRYRGGLAGQAQSVVVLPGGTSELLPLVLVEPGAASLATAPEMCVPAQLPARLKLRRSNADGVMERLPIPDALLSEPPCKREVEGLEEGRYEAVLVGPGERAPVLSASRFSVRPGERTQVTLPAPEVRVTGRVTVGQDRPGAGLALLFTWDGRLWRTQTDQGGEYAVTLGPVGDYTVSAQTSAGLSLATFRREFRAGEQTADLEVRGGFIDVRVERRDGAAVEEAVDLELTGPDGGRTSGSWQPGEEEVARFAGLEPGEYWVTARTPSGLASESHVRAEIIPGEPPVEVGVLLGQREGIVKVVDEAGTPVAGAEVAGRKTLPSRAEGRFSLRGVPVGERLRIRAAGYLPVCRVVQPEDLPEMLVALPKVAEPLVMHFDVQLPWESGLFLDLPGSDCPIALNELQFSARYTADRVTVALAFPRGRYQFALGQIGRPVTVPGDEVDLSRPASESSR